MAKTYTCSIPGPVDIAVPVLMAFGSKDPLPVLVSTPGGEPPVPLVKEDCAAYRALGSNVWRILKPKKNICCFQLHLYSYALHSARIRSNSGQGYFRQTDRHYCSHFELSVRPQIVDLRTFYLPTSFLSDMKNKNKKKNI